MKKSAVVYIAFCITLGIGLLIFLTIQEINYLSQYSIPEVRNIILGVAFLSVLAAIAESQSLALDENKAISIAFAISFSALLIYGLAAAAWVSFCTVFFSVVDFGRGKKEHVFNTPLFKTLMNTSNYIISVLAVGYVYQLLGGEYLRDVTFTDSSSAGEIFQFMGGKLPSILVGLIAYVIVNNLMIMLYFLVMTGAQTSKLTDWLKIFQWSVISMTCIGMLGVFLAAIFWAFGALSVLLFFAPFLMFGYAYVGLTSIQKGYIDTIKAFSAALEAKDRYTIGHARRVERYCEIIAEEMNLSSSRTKVLKYASLLHDIGKIGIKESILNKADRLTDDEYEEIKKHPVIGAQMLDGIQFLKKEVKIIKAHHVHFDGKGYPSDAVEEGKMLESQILCVADSFDAMTSDRAYRPAMTMEEAIDEMMRFSGTQFSPDVVEAFVGGLNKLKAKDELQEIME